MHSADEPSKPTLKILPSEIWDLIISKLGRENLLLLARTSHNYRAAVLRYLSRSVIIDVAEEYSYHWLYEVRLMDSDNSSYQKHGKPDQLGAIVQACKRIGLLKRVQSVCLALDSTQKLTCAPQFDLQRPGYASFIEHVELLISGENMKRLHVSLYSIPAYIPRGFLRLTSLELDVASDSRNPDRTYDPVEMDWRSLSALFEIPALETVIFKSLRCWTGNSCAGIGTPASSSVRNLIFLDSAPITRASPYPNFVPDSWSEYSRSNFHHLVGWLKGLETMHYEFTPGEKDLFIDTGADLDPEDFAQALRVHAHTLQRLTLHFGGDNTCGTPPNLVLKHFTALRIIDIPVDFIFNQWGTDKDELSPIETLPPNIETLVVRINGHVPWPTQSDPEGLSALEQMYEEIAVRLRAWISWILEFRHCFPHLVKIVLYWTADNWGRAKEETKPWNDAELESLQETVAAFAAAGIELVTEEDAPNITPDPLGMEQVYA